MSEENKTLETIEVEPIEPFDIDAEYAFPPLGEPNEQLRHTLLNDRDIPDQHPITAITGLREELDSIESLKTVVADKIGIANYYLWGDGMARDEFGYFVSLVPHTSSIQVCDGSDIFGVTVDRAGFIGGQDIDVPRNNNYGLVVTSGLVDVRCESDVEEGNYIIANTFGVAKKTTSGCGYKVVAKENKHGVDYAAISLGVQACTTDSIGRNVQRIEARLDDAEINIAAAMNTANSAYNKSLDSDAIAEEVQKQIQDAMDKIDDMQDVVDSTNNSVTNTSAVAAQARAIAESAVTEAIKIRNEANATANESLSNVNALIDKLEPLDEWVDPATGKVGAEYVVTYMDNQGLATKLEVQTVEDLTEENKSWIEKNAESISTMISSVDKYSVGEYSQAYGLTLEQAQSILKPGMIYIPTPHGDTQTHTESYEGSVDREFTSGFWYEWNGITWSEKLGNVWINTEPPVGDSFDYWYDGARLYIIQYDEWTEVATLAGNVNNRITSMIRQEVGKINLEVVDAHENIASLTERVDEAEAVVQTTAQWAKGKTADGDELYNIATIKQSASDESANLALVVADVSGNKILNGASIVIGSNDEGSSISFDADCINFDTGNFKLTADYIDLDGYATINDGFRIDKDGYMHATKGGSIGGFDIYDYNISSTPLPGYVEFHINSGDGDAGGSNWISAMNYGETTFKVTKTGVLHATGAVIEGKITATDGKIGQCEIDENGLFIKDKNGRTLFTAGYNSTFEDNVVEIAGWRIDNNSIRAGSLGKADSMWLCRNGTSTHATIGTSGNISGWSIAVADKFGVTKEGVLYGKDVNLSGNITVTEGQIGPWQIGKTAVTGAHVEYASIKTGDNYGEVHLTSWGIVYKPADKNYSMAKTWEQLLTDLI